MTFLIDEPVLLHDPAAAVVVAPERAEWPTRCVCCNVDVDGPPVKVSVSTMSVASWLGVGLIFAPLPLLTLRVAVGLFLAVIARKRRTFRVRLCPAHRSADRTRQGVFVAIAAVCGLVAAWGITSGSVGAPEPWAVGAIAAVALLLTGVFAAWVLPIVKVVAIDTGVARLRLRGDGAFARSLPTV